MTDMIAKMNDIVPSTVKETLKVRLFTLFKIPLVAFLGPKILVSTDEKMVIKLPLRYRSKNHLGAMYFGALSVGADLVIGLMSMRQMEKAGTRVSLVFKDFKAEFLKRAEGDVHFVCEEGLAIKALTEKAIASGEREEQTFRAYALVPDQMGDEPVAQFELTLSLKRRG